MTDEAGKQVHLDRYETGTENPGKLLCAAFDNSFDDLFAYLSYDAAGRLTFVWDGNHSTNLYKHPPPDEADAVLAYAYGPAGELPSITHRNANASTSTELFRYNVEGTLRERVPTEGRTIGYL